MYRSLSLLLQLTSFELLKNVLCAPTFVFVGPVRAVPISVALILGAYAASVTDTLEVVAVTSDTVVAVLLVRPVAAVGRSVAAPSARDAATWRGRAQHLVRGAHHRA